VDPSRWSRSGRAGRSGRRERDEREERINALYSRYDELRETLSRRTGSRAAADEAVAAAFVVAWDRWESMPAEFEEAVAWLAGTAWNLARNAYRAAQRDRDLLARVGAEVGRLDAEAERDDPEPLAVAWRSLSDADREVLRLSAWEGLAPEDIARGLGISPGAAANRLWRARGRLNDAFDRVDAADGDERDGDGDE
jgi:RNA polymerase sigma-70 factor, ECF subfamily